MKNDKKTPPAPVITKVGVSFGRKVQVHQYEPDELVEWVEAEIPEGCSPTVAKAQLREGLVTSVDEFFVRRMNEGEFQTAADKMKGGRR